MDYWEVAHFVPSTHHRFPERGICAVTGVREEREMATELQMTWERLVAPVSSL